MAGRCTYGGTCTNTAEFLDPMHNAFCEDCMHLAVREEEDVEYEDFESIIEEDYNG